MYVDLKLENTKNQDEPPKLILTLVVEQLSADDAKIFFERSKKPITDDIGGSISVTKVDTIESLLIAMELFGSFVATRVMQGNNVTEVIPNYRKAFEMCAIASALKIAEDRVLSRDEVE